MTTNVEVYDDLHGVVEAIDRALGVGEEPPLYPPFVRGERLKRELRNLRLIQR